MKTISWDKYSYYIDHKPTFLISGEFHYFRVPKKDWKKRLELFKEAGGNCVATYIPWILHEPKEGDIRFSDIPERDLEGFLQLCRDMNLFVICRPGPYQYSEMRYDGLPGWLCENYPEILATDINGKAFRSSSVSYLHPVFLEKTRKWFDNVCPIIAEYTLGGPVAFVQYDNEIMGIHHWYNGFDYNRQAMGIGHPDGRYPSFLKERYKTIKRLNEAYQTNYKSFTEVVPFDGFPGNTGEMRTKKDYQDFYFEMMAEYGEILVEWMKSCGIDCDIIHNAGSPNMNSFLLETVKRLGKQFLLGTDHYYNLGQDFGQNNPTPQHMSRVFISIEILRLMGFPPTVMELQAGSAADWPPITPEDVKCYYYSNLAFGMKGLNYYIFTGGPNPEGIGSFGDDYDYGAGIGSDGSIRPIYSVQKEFGNFLSENSWLTKAGQVCDFYVGLDWEHSRSKSYFNKCGFYEFSSSEAWEFLRKGILTTAFQASFSSNFVDLYTDELLSKTDKPLIIATSVVMPEEVQRRLVKYVWKGGRVLLAPVIPYLDQDFKPCTVLQDFLEGTSVTAFNGNYPRVNIGNTKNIHMNGKIFKDTGKFDKEILGSEEYTGSILCWKRNFPDNGMVIWLGFEWKYSMHTHREFFQYLLKEMGCEEPVVCCKNHNLWTSLRRNGKQGILFVMNFYSSFQDTDIVIKEGRRAVAQFNEVKLKPMEVKIFTVDFQE